MTDPTRTEDVEEADVKKALRHLGYATADTSNAEHLQTVERWMDDLREELEEALREAKRGVDELHRAAESLREVEEIRRLATHDDARSDEGGVRVTCANGHTSTFRDLRDESDCTAPCCPRDGCDECSFTFEPSDLFDPMWGDVVFATPLAGGDDGG